VSLTSIKTLSLARYFNNRFWAICEGQFFSYLTVRSEVMEISLKLTSLEKLILTKNYVNNNSGQQKRLNFFWTTLTELIIDTDYIWYRIYL